MTDKKKGAATGPFRRILVVCDDPQTDDAILAMVTRLAGTWDAEVTALAAIDLPSDLSRIARLSGVAPKVIAERIVEERSAQLIESAKSAAKDRLVRVAVASGKPFLEVIRLVLSEGYDLVVKMAETIEGMSPRLFASTDQHLLRKCPCPVWLRSNQAPAQARLVVAAVDVDDLASTEPKAQAALNERIVETAADMAAVEGAVLHVIHAWDALGESTMRRWTGDQDLATLCVGQIEAEHQQALEDLVARSVKRLSMGAAAQIAITPRLVRGMPRLAIPTYIRDQDADLLVMGTIARTGVQGFIIGNTAEDILNSVECSVVTVKPPGYVSPVAP